MSTSSASTCADRLKTARETGSSSKSQSFISSGSRSHSFAVRASQLSPPSNFWRTTRTFSSPDSRARPASISAASTKVREPMIR